MRKSTEEKLKRFTELYEQGYSRLDIMAMMGMKSGQTYYVYLELMRGGEALLMQKSDERKKREPQYAPEKKPEAVPVVIKGQRYLDVTSFFM